MFIYNLIKSITSLISFHVMQVMQDVQELKETYDRNIQKTIVVSQKNYNRLKQLGFGGDSFNTIVGRLLDRVEDSE